MNTFNKKTCKACNRNRHYTNIAGIGYCEYPTNINSLWRGSFCSECPKDKYNKNLNELNRLFAKKVSGEPEVKSCKDCGVSSTRIYCGVNAHNSGVYKAQDGRHWHGRICPDCWNKVEQVRRNKKIKPPKPVYTKACVVCSTEFTTEVKNKECCSNACRTQKSRNKVGVTKCSGL